MKTTRDLFNTLFEKEVTAEVQIIREKKDTDMRYDDNGGAVRYDADESPRSHSSSKLWDDMQQEKTFRKLQGTPQESSEE